MFVLIMYPPIACFCGRSIGEIYEYFVEERRRRIEAISKHTATSPDNWPHIRADVKNQVDMSDVFAELGINHECCKSRLSHTLEFRQFY